MFARSQISHQLTGRKAIIRDNRLCREPPSNEYATVKVLVFYPSIRFTPVSDPSQTHAHSDGIPRCTKLPNDGNRIHIEDVVVSRSDAETKRKEDNKM